MVETKAFLTRLWKLENDERPGFMIGYTGPEVIGGNTAKSALFSTDGKDTVKDRLLDPEKYLQAQLEEINNQLKLEGDFIPSLCPSLGVIGIASAFGCEVVWWQNEFPAAKPLLHDNLGAITDLVKPGIRDGELGRILDYTEYFLQATDGEYQTL